MTKIYLLRVRAESSVFEDVGDSSVSLPGFMFEKTLLCTKDEKAAVKKFYEYSGKYYGKEIPGITKRGGSHYYNVELYLEEYRFDEREFSITDELVFDEESETDDEYPIPYGTIEGEEWTVMPKGWKN